jgi:hydrogenase expression/formation protein
VTDLEGIANHMIDLNRSDASIMNLLIPLYELFKPNTAKNILEKLSRSILDEVKKSRIPASNDIIQDLLAVEKVNLSVGDQGVGCRGLGDFVVHESITRMASSGKSAYLGPQSMDDAGAIILGEPQGNVFIVTKMEGMHSRLSNYPFIAGFHVTRACLRDLLVKGSRPVSLMVDIHLGDDCDVSKLFDFMAGVTCVSELAGVPITAGSTLRIGGDMVIGDRITGGIAGVGICDKILARKDIKMDCDIIMTEGAGGGTIATTAIYNGQPDKIVNTLNIKFIQAMNILLERPELLEHVYCCSDVTNGGLRGDIFEIMKSCDLGAEIYEQNVRDLVNETILQMLDETNTDYLGVSLDALLVFCEPGVTDQIIASLNEKAIKAMKIGSCTRETEIMLHAQDGTTKKIIPRFRESAYTPIKKVIGEKKDKSSQDQMNALVTLAYQKAMEKKQRIHDFITGTES